jgi:glycosyltransferase involved in cell wall biosynthesis
MGRASFVAGAIESVLDQSFEDWSLVISENGKPDPVIASTLLPYLSDARVRYVSVNGEISAASHHTRLVTNGEARYVAVLHDDDRWHRGMLADRIALLERHDGSAFAFSGARIVDDGGGELMTNLPELPGGLQAPASFVPFLYGGNLIHVSTTVLRRSALEAVGAAFHEEFPTYDDHELWFRLAVRFPVVYLRQCDVDVRRHGAQLSLERKLRGEERLRLLDHFDGLLSADLPGAVSPGRRRQVRADVLLSSALDEIQRRDPARSS